VLASTQALGLLRIEETDGSPLLNDLALQLPIRHRAQCLGCPPFREAIIDPRPQTPCNVATGPHLRGWFAWQICRHCASVAGEALTILSAAERVNLLARDAPSLAWLHHMGLAVGPQSVWAPLVARTGNGKLAAGVELSRHEFSIFMSHFAGCSRHGCLCR